ncbi:MAG: glycosyltransferase family 4 protein [Acidimicrobiia bacterium]
MRADMIVTFAWPSSHHRTGGVVVLYHFANGLARRGHEVHFLHGPAWPGRIDAIEQLDWFRFEPTVQHHVVDSMDDPALPASDVVFARTALPHQGLPALFVQGAHMLPAEMEEQAYRLDGPKVCVARWLIDRGRSLGVPEAQLWPVTLGLDHELFRRVAPLDDRPYDVAIVHHDHPTKGWGVGLEALRELHRRRPRLSVAVFGGAGRPAELEPWMDFRDYPTHEVLAEEVYNASKVFLQPSHFEGFGLTCIEAMACGAALVTTDNGGSAEYAVDGDTAVVVPPGDPMALAEAADALLHDDERRAALAERGARAVRRFDWEVGTDELEARLLDYVAEPARFRAPAVSTTVPAAEPR